MALSETLGETTRFQWSFHHVHYYLIAIYGYPLCSDKATYIPTTVNPNISKYFGGSAILPQSAMNIYICMYIHMFYPCFVRNPNWHRSPAACCLICGTWQAFWREALVETDMCSWRGTKTSLNSLILATQKNLMSLKSSNFG